MREIRGMRGALMGAACALALVVNPAYFMGCGSSDGEEEESYQFGEAELRAAGTGSFVGAITQGGQQVSYTLTLSQASASGQALRTVGQGLCGSRSFIKQAAACIAVTTMPLTGTMIIGGDQAQAVTGELSVYGATFERGELRIRRADGVDMTISVDEAGAGLEPGAISPQGSWTIGRPQ